jgi:hypothetical protein
MDADKGLEDLAGRGVLDGLSLQVGEGRLRVLKRLADARLQGGIHPHAAGQNPQQGHVPVVWRAIEGRGPQAWIVQATASRVPHAAGLWTPPAEPGGHRGVSSSVVTRMQHLSGALSASWAASDEGRPPVI